MEGLSLRPDHWHSIGQYLTPTDLCRVMQVSKNWFHLWVTDRAWMHQRMRLCRLFHGLNAVFDVYCDAKEITDHVSKRAIKSNSNKKRKTAWITPRKGIWYTFKRWLSLGCSKEGFKKLARNVDMECLTAIIFMYSIPYHERITTYTINRWTVQQVSSIGTRICYRTKHYEIIFDVMRYEDCIYTRAKSLGGDRPSLFTTDLYCEFKPDHFGRWKRMLLQQSAIPIWSVRFSLMMYNNL